MTRIFLFSVIIGFLLGYTVRGHAAETSLSASLSYGPSSVSDRSSPDLETRGNFREFLALVTRSLPRWNFGAGLGFFASDLSGTNRSAGTAGELTLRSYSRSVAGEVGRLSTHYRVSERLEAGVTAELLFGSDVSFGSSFFDSASTAWLAGAETLYDFGRDASLLGFRFKAGARYFATVARSDRNLDAFQGVFEAALPL